MELGLRAFGTAECFDTLRSPSSGWMWGAVSIAVWVRVGLVKVLLWRWQLRRLRNVCVWGMTKV